jgi:D-lactate dehydrogenase (cytochrome)
VELTRMAVDRALDAVAALRGLFPNGTSVAVATRHQHANTFSAIPSQPPSVVVWPESVADVQSIVEVATRYRVPLIPYGAGTSLEGHVNAPFGGICLDMSRMNRIIRVSPVDQDCEVEAGCTRRQLGDALHRTGLFFSVDPGAETATLGGMAATRASGTNSVCYGTMRDNVLGLTAVMADGSVISTGSRARKSAAGYDLTRLLIGSEGTLGVITSVIVRLHPVPDSTVSAVATFPSIEAACEAANAALALGSGLARVELLDGAAIEAINKSTKLTLTALPSLFFELHGRAVATKEHALQLKTLVQNFGAVGFQWAVDDAERHKLWRARHDAFWAIREAWPERTPVTTDVCVPVSKLAYCVKEATADCAALNLIAPIVGHVGDGNFHTIVMVDTSDTDELRRLRVFLGRLIDNALACGGTCSGEHGIGQGKMAALALEAGTSLAVMKQIKSVLDPLGVLNPGKMFQIGALESLQIY